MTKERVISVEAVTAAIINKITKIDFLIGDILLDIEDAIHIAKTKE
ncbi:hypothetical protein [Sphaerospermopsis aphanizomenoides]|nr:hypothetical protein [Sphaerospermopsis aphanizomenoides]